MWIHVDLPGLPDGMTVTIGPLVGMPDDRESWIANALRAHLPASTRVKRIATSEVTHGAGWPVTVVAIGVLDEGGRETERRIAFVFELEVFGAIVMAHVASRAIVALEARTGRALLEALLDAPIRLHGDEVVAIAELDA